MEKLTGKAATHVWPNSFSLEKYIKENKLVKDGNDTVLKKLFNDIGKRYDDRPGGYTRILKRIQVRLGDAGATAIIELVKDEEKTLVPTAPAPAVAN